VALHPPDSVAVNVEPRPWKVQVVLIPTRLDHDPAISQSLDWPCTDTDIRQTTMNIEVRSMDGALE